jgi:hypothetical protein
MITPREDANAVRLMPPSFEEDYVEGALKPFFLTGEYIGERPSLPMIDLTFMNLGDERDPNVGLQEDEATFAIPHAPVRRRIHGIETFNVPRGGEYFFMPSLSALSWLGNLDEQQER